MRQRRKRGFWLLGCVSALSACDPNLDKLSAEFGQGGMGGADSALGSGGNSAGSGADAGTGTVDPCADQKKEPNEADVDCGGSSRCARCALNANCAKDSDCASAVCLNNGCAAQSCADGIQDQDETGKDCGGMCAPASLCDIGVGCKNAADCASDYCPNGKCVDHCTSRSLEADETDIDCGGSTCSPCSNDSACLQDADCASAICANEICVPPSCDDQLRNQDESDVDCGGVCSVTKPCAVGASCNQPSDCATYLCTAKHCAVDITIPGAAVIDDMEDGNLALPANGGRVGNWYPFGDGSGTELLEPFVLPQPRAGSAKCLHFSATAFTSWGFGIGLDFDNPGTASSSKLPYDASAYSGITLWAKSAAAISTLLQIPDIDTTAAGMRCTTCDHHYETLIALTTDWQRFTVHFSDLVLEPGTVPAPTAFAKNGLVEFQLFFASGKAAELWIDDVAFIE